MVNNKVVTWVGVLLAGGGYTLGLAVQHSLLTATLTAVGALVAGLGKSLLGDGAS